MRRLGADREVDPIRPDLDVARCREVPRHEGLEVLGEALRVPVSDRCRESGRRAEELGEPGHEVRRRQSVQVEQSQQPAGLGRPAAPRREERGGEALQFAARRVDPLVVHPGCRELETPGGGRDHPPGRARRAPRDGGRRHRARRRGSRRSRPPRPRAGGDPRAKRVLRQPRPRVDRYERRCWIIATASGNVGSQPLGLMPSQVSQAIVASGWTPETRTVPLP